MFVAINMNLALEMVSYSTEDVFVAPRPRVDEKRRVWGEQSHQRYQAESRIALGYGATLSYTYMRGKKVHAPLLERLSLIASMQYRGKSHLAS